MYQIHTRTRKLLYSEESCNSKLRFPCGTYHFQFIHVFENVKLKECDVIRHHELQIPESNTICVKNHASSVYKKQVKYESLSAFPVWKEKIKTGAMLIIKLSIIFAFFQTSSFKGELFDLLFLPI